MFHCDKQSKQAVLAIDMYMYKIYARYLLLAMYYILFINIRDKNKRTILGNMYLDNTYKINTIIAKANTTSFM